MMTVDQAITFLEESSRYYQKKMVTTDEDMEFWACKNNSDNCLRVVEVIREMRRQAIEEAITGIESKFIGQYADIKLIVAALRGTVK